MAATFAAPLPASADSIQDQLQQLQQQEANQRSTLQNLAAQQAAAQAILAQLRSDLYSKQADFLPILNQARDLDDRISSFEAQEQSLQAAHDSHLRSFLAQTRGLYKAGPASWLTFIFEAGSFSDLIDRLISLTRLTKANADEAQRLKDERLALVDQRHKTEALREALDPLLRQLAQRVADAQNAYTAQASVAYSLDAQEAAQRAALQRTQGQEHQLEAALAAQQAAAAAAAQKGAGRAYGSVCPAAPAGKISICGHGWGHGVGLAQYGALGMAQAGFSYSAILSHFYSGTAIGNVPPQTVRVFLTGAGHTITPRIASATIQDQGGAVHGTVPQDVAVTFNGNGDGSVSASWPGGSYSGKPVRLVPGGGGLFQVSGSGSRYRGEAWVDNTTGFKVIDHVDLESYLQGLAEVPSSWALGAIEAQTVAARTYALYHLGGGLYDVDDTVNYQVYGGYDRESSSQNAAVAATHGQAVMYQGQIVDAVFSSSDGGHSECASAAWGNGDNPCTPSYLRGVVDNYDVSPLHTWYTPPHTWAEIQSYLGATYNSASCGTLTGLDLSNRDASDRLNAVRMVGAAGTCTVSPGAFIRAINAGSPADFIVYGDMFGINPGNRAWPYW